MTRDGIAAWLGIDWADEKHRWAMRINGENRIQQGDWSIHRRRLSSSINGGAIIDHEASRERRLVAGRYRTIRRALGGPKIVLGPVYSGEQ